MLHQALVKASAFFIFSVFAPREWTLALWVLASMTDASYISVMICFVMFLANDLYGFISWRRMEKRQNAAIVQE